MNNLQNVYKIQVGLRIFTKHYQLNPKYLNFLMKNLVSETINCERNILT